MSKVQQAVARRAAGEKVADIARDLGITAQAIYEAIRRAEGRLLPRKTQRASRAAPKQAERVCAAPGCGNILPPDARPNQVTCCDKCRFAMSNAKRKLAKAADPLATTGPADLFGTPAPAADLFEQARAKGEARAKARALAIDRRKLGLGT